MVGAFGEVQVMDWGLAKVLGDATRATAETLAAEETQAWTQVSPTPEVGSHTQAGSLVGTPAFIPPEQALGEIERVNERSDVFGLGAILAVILTGKPPYVGETFESVRVQAARGRLEDCYARLDASGAEPELVALCKTCLAFEPARRPANAGAVAAAVAELRTAADERARRAELDRVKAEGDRAAAELRATEQWKRRKVQAALGLSFTALVMLGGAFAWWAQDQRLAKEAEARERRAAAQREVSQAVEDAVAKFGRANGAGRDSALWAEARAAAAQAQVRATEADAPPEVHDHIRRLLADIEQLEKNRRLVATLLEIHTGMGDTLTVQGDQDFAGADARYRRAFRDYGTDLFSLSPEDGAELLRRLGSEVRVDLAAAIDDWAYVRFIMAGYRLDGLARLFQMTRLLDPDPVRNRIRDIVAARDAAALNRLAEEIDPAVQPIQTVNLVAVYLYSFRPLDEGHKVAARFLRKAQPYHPGDFQINHNLAYYLNNERRPAEALPYALAAIAVRPKSSAAWLDYLRSLSNTGRDAEVIAVQRRLCALSPLYFTIRFELAAQLDKVGDPAGAAAARADALRICEEILRAAPKDALRHVGVGNALWAVKEKARAEACYHKATRIDPNYSEAFANWGNARRMQGDAKGAIPPLREATRLDPKSTRAHDLLGLAYLSTGDFERAFAAFEEAFRLDPKYFGINNRLNLARHIQDDPGNAQLHVVRGGILQTSGDLDGVIAAYREATRLEPQNSGRHNGLAGVLLQKGDVPAALVAAREAVRLDPQFAFARYNQGKALELTGDLDGAIAEYAEAVRLSPTTTAFQTALDNANKLKVAREAKPRNSTPPPREGK
jgi:tetratricopeptide (TPR) repeat protein